MKENGKTQVFFEISKLKILKSSIFNSRTKNSLFYYNLGFIFMTPMFVKNTLHQMYGSLLKMIITSGYKLIYST